MGMDGTALGLVVANAIIATDPDMTSEQQAQLRTAWEAIGNAMVPYIQTNAVINPGTFSNTGGPVTGKGTIS
jgi:hypothetical protein